MTNSATLSPTWLQFALLTLSVAGCADPRSHPGDATEARTEAKLVFINEGDSFPEEVKTTPAQLDAREVRRFHEQWNKLAEIVARELASGRLVRIADWPIRSDGRDITTDQLRSLPFQPRSSSNAADVIIFAVETQESNIDVGAHLPIVKRRLIVAAIFDTRLGSIAKVYVTIRGWTEE